jgi:hypothetical protein
VAGGETGHHPRSVRRLYLLIVAVAILLFLAVSTLLARVWSADGAEASAITALIQAQARGDQIVMLDRIQGCAASASCRARVAYDAAALRQPGTVSILQVQPSTGFSLTGSVGTARVAWGITGSPPIVQCVRVRRAGDAIVGIRIELLAISARLIKSDADCPSRF